MHTPPVFLVGAERSGTTLLRLLLDSHPNIAFQFEFEYVVDQLDELGAYPDLKTYYQYLETHRIFQMHPFKIDKSLSYPALVQSFLIQKQTETGKPLIGATVHHHFSYLLHLWPEARFIHLLRDGRDVARSVQEMGWAGLPYFGTRRWIIAELHWNIIQAQLPPERYITVYYEELVSDPDAVLHTICDFLGVPFDKAVYNYEQQGHYQRPSGQFKEQWRKKMTPYQIRLVEGRIGLSLVARGYQLSGLPPRFPTPLEMRWLKLLDRLNHILFRLRRYPLSLYLPELISRRLGFKKWHKKIQKQLNDYENKLLR